MVWPGSYVVWCMGTNQGRQSRLKTGGVTDPGLKSGSAGSVVDPVLGPKNSTEGAHSTGMRVSSPEFLLNFIQNFLFLKSPLLENVLISYSHTL